MFFKKSYKEFDILPPPPPFPGLEIEDEAIKSKAKQAKEKLIEKKLLQKPMPKIKGKIKLKFKKEKKQKTKADTGLEELRNTLLSKPKPAEGRHKEEIGPGLEKAYGLSEIGLPVSEHAQMPKKQSFFDHTLKSKIQGNHRFPVSLGNSKDFKEISDGSKIFGKKEAKKKAKEEKRKAREERKKQKKTEKELAKQKHMEERKRVIEGKTTAETEEPLPDLEPIKIEKPSEIFKAEHEINKAIKDLKKKPKKPLFSFLKPKKENFPKPGLRAKTTPKEESPEKLPALEIKGPTDEVNVIKHKIHDARSALMNFDLKKAKILYIKTMKLYQSLSPEKQALVYEQIKDLYNERMHAEGLKFKQ